MQFEEDLQAPLSVAYSTAAVAPADRLEAWKATLGSFLPLTISQAESDYRASLSATVTPQWGATDIRSQNAVVERSARDVARATSGLCYVFQQIGPQGSYMQMADGTSHFLAPGDLMVGDADEYFLSQTAGEYHHRFWSVPRAWLGEQAGRVAAGVAVRAQCSEGRLLRSFLNALWEQSPHLDRWQLVSSGQALGLLMGMASGIPDSRVDGDIRDSIELVMLKRQIDAFLGDPLLSPGRLAARCGVSVRKLHTLFKQSGTSFGSYVMQQRLDRAHRVLSTPSDHKRTVAQIAFALGFNSLATFYRAYRARYDENPRDTLRRHLQPRPG